VFGKPTRSKVWRNASTGATAHAATPGVPARLLALAAFPHACDPCPRSNLRSEYSESFFPFLCELICAEARTKFKIYYKRNGFACPSPSEHDGRTETVHTVYRACGPQSTFHQFHPPSLASLPVPVRVTVNQGSHTSISNHTKWEVS